jgi:hypothetical protein
MIEAVRVFAVIGLVTAAAALATPPGRIPLAFRGIFKILGRNVSSAESSAVAPLWKRFVAFLLVLAAAAVALA